MSVRLPAIVPRFVPAVIKSDGCGILVPQLSGPAARFQLQVKADPRFSLFNDSSRGGFVSARYTVEPGDTWESGASGIRAEIADFEKSRFEVEGSDVWWAWSTRIPNEFVVEGNWNIFAQWHEEGPGFKPPLAFDIVRENSKDVMRVLTRGGDAPNYRNSTKWVLDDSIDRDAWYDFVVHLISSSDPNTGRLVVWLNGQKKADEATNVLYKKSGGGSYSNYFKQGLYRGSVDQMKTTVAVEHAATRRGTACTSVAPSAFCAAAGAP